MWKVVIEKEKQITPDGKVKTPTGQYLAKSALIVMVATILSRILGLIREMTIVNVFGVTGTTDAFYLAFNIPELIRTLVISGVLSSIFIPIYASIREKKSFAEAKSVTAEIFSFTIIIAILTVIVGAALAPNVIWLAKAISFGNVDPQTMENAIRLTRLLFPMLIFISLSGLVQGILNSVHDFKTPAFAPLLFNVVIIGSLIGFKVSNPEFDNIDFLAFAVVVGTFFQLAVQIPSLKYQGFRLFKIPDFKHEAFVQLRELAPAAMMGYATMTINGFVDKAMAFGMIPNGGMTTLWLGGRLQQIPFSVFGVTLVTVLFPIIAQHVAAKRFDDLKVALDRGIRVLAFTLIPSSVFFMSMSVPVVRLIFNHGQFQNFPQGVEWTAGVLKYYTLGIFPGASLLLISRVFFSFHDTKTPLKAGILMVIINYCLNLYLGHTFQVKGIACATSIVAYLNCILLIYFLKSRLPDIWKSYLNIHILKLLIAGIIQFVIVTLVLKLVPNLLGEPTTLKDALVVICGIILSIAVFGGAIILMKCDEWKMLREYLKNKDKGSVTTHDGIV